MDQTQPTKEEILLDIYFFQKELEKSVTSEDKDYYKSKLKEAEELFKNIN